MGLTSILKDLFRDGALHRWQQRRKDREAIAAWEKAGQPLPPPQAFKKQLIRQMAQRFGTRVLVETGTNWGNTIAASLGTFDTIYSIELLDELYNHARRRFARVHKVKLRHGDSARELPLILEELKEPALFWLDAHYSGEGTARAAVDTPVVKEIEAISRHFVENHVILIDDARLFDGKNDYPTIEAYRTLVSTFWPAHQFSVQDDIIRITPA